MPRGEPNLTVRAARPVVSGLINLGYDPEPMLTAVGIDPASLNDPDAQIPMSRGVALLAHAVAATGDPDLGLHLAEHADLGTLDVHFYAMLSSPTLADAYERLCRYQRLIHDTTRVTLEIEAERATLRHQMPGGAAVPRQSAEFIVAAWVRGGRVATARDWRPLEVRFAHGPPAGTAEHVRFFGSPVNFAAGENALVLPASVLKFPCSGANPSLLAVLDRYAADLMGPEAAATRFVDRARAALVEELQGGRPSAARLAARLNVSVRTLGRALYAEGTSYRQLLDQLRQELALRYLRDRRVAIAEVAYLTGFSELSAFYRAFRRWTGQTPAELRARHRG